MEQALPKTFIVRVRRRGDILELTIPRKVVKMAGLKHGDLIEVTVNRIIANTEV
jgi:antitoxin component of MazEF toxin-antitoxin module